MILFEPRGRRPVLHTGGCCCGVGNAGRCPCRRLLRAACCVQLGAACSVRCSECPVRPVPVLLYHPTCAPVRACPAGDCRLIPEMQQEEALVAVRCGSA